MTFLERLSAFLSSAIIRQQLGAIIAAVAALVGLTTNVEVINQKVEVFIVALLALIPVLTIFTRIFKPAPNLSVTAIDKEKQLRAVGKISVDGAHPNVQKEEDK